MKTNSLLLLPLLLAAACSPKSNENVAGDSTEISTAPIQEQDPLVEVPSREIELTSIWLELPDRGRFLVELHPMELGVGIFAENDLLKPVQTLGPIDTDMDLAQDRYLDDPYLIFNPDDLNFDGYPDLRIPVTAGTGGIWYDTYLYDPKAERYVRNQALSQLPSIEADASSKTLVSFNVGAMGGAVYSHTTYSWKSGALFIEREEFQEFAPDEAEGTFLRTVLEVNAEEGMDTVAWIKINLKDEVEYWCLLKGSWEPLEDSPHNNLSAIRKDGRRGGC
ncbi:MAG: hypothetical protein HC842_09915 [Cytophagales bacterium]|nr:hypothetical protein [Cytophagales bacterium]